MNTKLNVLQDLEYTWKEIGNLSNRKSWMNTPQNQNLVEIFTYDNINRLKNITLNGSQKGAHQYDPAGLGNLISKQASGQVLFDGAAYGEDDYGPHAITSANIVSGVFPADNQQIVYNSYDKVTELSEGAKQLSITYGTHRQRIEQEYDWQFILVKKRWAGACEYITFNGQQRIITYLSGPEGVFALHVIHPDASESIHYVHKDHLGSWHTITDEDGNLLQELSFDAWGTRRNPQTWDAFTGVPPSPLYDRGFTGHEHLYAFGLINMNGRIYDPLVSRMLSPDNFIQSPDFSQSFNRYSYAWNNPLVYTDPDGEWLFMAIAVGVMFNVGIQAASGNINNVGDFFIAAGIGALSGATGAYAAGALSVSMGLTASGAMSGAVWGATAGFTSGFISGAGNSWMNGNGFLNGVKDGLITGGISGATGGIMGGLSGGITATRNNKDFWSGMPNLNGRIKLTADHIPNAELNMGNIKRSKILPFYEDSELYYDGDILTWRDYFTDGSYQVRDTWSAWSGGRNPKSSDVFGGRIPNGTWDLVSIQEGGPSTYERFKVKFYGDLEPRFSLPPARTGGFEIHPDGGRFGTAGCIGLQVSKESLLMFYNMSETYVHRLGFLRVIVNY